MNNPSSNSSGTFTYSSNNNIVDISGNSVILKKLGKCEITATQVETGNYNSKSTTINFYVKTIPTITGIPTTITKIYETNNFKLDPSSNSLGAFTYDISGNNTNVATVDINNDSTVPTKENPTETVPTLYSNAVAIGNVASSAVANAARTGINSAAEFSGIDPLKTPQANFNIIGDEIQKVTYQKLQTNSFGQQSLF